MFACFQLEVINTLQLQSSEIRHRNDLCRLTFGVVFKYLSSPLPQEAVFIQPVLNIPKTSDSVPQVVA